ncbi:uncharacterized protein LOC141673604 [Apium graveolens]|uniref:uncharacterized protein LOC141673604 n=1 Tax=Apium graveolens TaxID=4045 RepID=UPI003D7A7C18
MATQGNVGGGESQGPTTSTARARTFKMTKRSDAQDSDVVAGSRRKITCQLFTFSIDKENSSINSTVPEKRNHNVQGSSGLGIKRNPLGQLSQTSSSKGWDERFLHANKNSQSQDKLDASNLIYHSGTTQLTGSRKEGHVNQESSSGHKRFSPGPLSPSSAPKALRIKNLQFSEQSKLLHQHSLHENADPNVSASSKSGKYITPLTYILFANIYLACPRKFDNILILSFVSRATNPAQSPVARILQNRPTLAKKHSMFELSASRIIPSNNPNLNMNDPVHCCKNLRSPSKLHAKDKKAQIDIRITENSTIAKKRERRNTVSVTIPETEDLGVPLPCHWFPRNEDFWKEYMNLGPPSKICGKCKSRMWNEERNNKSNKNSPPTFSICCKNGQVELSKERPPPPFLYYMLSGGEKTVHFLKNIRTLKPKEGQSPKFAQLYVYDTDNEIQNRMDVVLGSDGFDPEIVEGLLKMLDENNKLSEGFCYARDRLNIPDTDDFSLIMVYSQAASARKNQYQLLFPYADNGFHLNIPLKSKKQNVHAEPVNDQHPDETRHRTTVTMREYYAYKLMISPDERMNLHVGGRLWQQFIVDAFAAVEQYRLDWIRNHQSTIRSDLYRSIRDSLTNGDTNTGDIGKNVILPATHTSSQRYMNQYFKDSLAICRTIGHPSLFLTMTCNTQWPEIKQMMKYLLGVDVAIKPDVIARVFRLKLDQLLDLIKKKNYFGKFMHVTEFQKRGLPHCHMLIWLHPQSRPQHVQQIDELIYVKIPDKNTDLIGYNIVQAHMIHGPCGKDFSYSPCMVKGKCGRHFPKKYNANTFFDDCGFSVYRRRRTEASVLKKGVLLDNQYVVPYDRDLLLRFHCHINLKVCNSSRSLKYLSKYCLKGHDTVTMLLRKKNKKDTQDESTTKTKLTDEIKNFLDGRYICMLEAAWRLLGFDIHHRFPSVERLVLHMEDEKSVSFKPQDDLGDVAERDKTRFTKLEVWFEANKTFPEARKYTYTEFSTYFTWKADLCKWKFRQRGQVFGRLSEVHSHSGETFFLGCYSCTSKDDRHWDVAMSENAVHAMPRQLRQLFIHILSNNQSFSLAEIEKLFNDVGKSLKDYNSMPFLDDSSIHGLDNRLFVGRVVLPVASSGIATMLLPGGRTVHSRFHIPLKVDEYSVAKIKHGTELGELLKQTSFIIWDEASM